MYKFRKFDEPLDRDQLLDLMASIEPQLAFMRALADRVQDKKIIVYGCGDLGRMCRQFCQIEHIDIAYFVDANAQQRNLEDDWRGIEIQTPDVLAQLDPENCLILVCIVNFPLAEIFQMLEQRGFNHIVTFYDFAQKHKSIYPLNNGWLADLQTHDSSRISKVLNLFDDPLSAYHYASFFAWRVARQEWRFDVAPVDIHNRFFIDDIQSTIHQTGPHRFADIGAHLGLVSLKLHALLQDQLHAIYCFEPDPINLQKLKDNLKLAPMPHNDIHYFDDVLWSDHQSVPFTRGFNYASSICTNGDKMQARPLDSFDLSPTIIKIHTEGSELDILKGAQETIARQKPIIMMTIYHNSAGLYDVFEYMANALKDYEIMFRNHAWAGTGAVVYCSPRRKA